jgi:flagellar motor switch protein FliG
MPAPVEPPAPPPPAPPPPAPPPPAPPPVAAAPVRPAPPVPAPPPPDPNDPLTALTEIRADRLARVLADETPRTIALILNYLEVTQAGDIFKRLAPATRNEVSVQFSSQAMPSLEVLQRIAQALVRKSQQLTDKPRFPDGTARKRKMADMLRLLEKPERLQVLGALESKDPQSAADIKEMLYRFDDVLRIENRSMQKILMDIDTKNLAVALKDAGEDIQQKFLANLSKRAQENLQEELELVQNTHKDQVEQAQKAIVAVIQRLDLAGELTMTE